VNQTTKGGFMSLKKVSLLLALTAPVTFAVADNVLEEYKRYAETLQQAELMFRDEDTQKMIKEVDENLRLYGVTWEDTGRAQGSSVGPNISDMSIQAHYIDERGKTAGKVMPVLRYENFDDKTADVDTGKFMIPVGNEKGKELTLVSLADYLSDLPKYLSKPEGFKAPTKSLLSPRDTVVLTSPQVSFLPVTKTGETYFNPVLFNYQSSKGNPAVLAILVTREGTSATVIENDKDRGGFEEHGTSGQRLFFNENGKAYNLTAKRASQVLATEGALPTNQATANGESGANMVMLIQVPLKHKVNRRNIMMFGLESAPLMMSRAAVGVEEAVIGHGGEPEGDFIEANDLAIERDHRFPIRVTVQFYMATDTAKLSRKQVVSMQRQLQDVLQGEGTRAVGSLVTDGQTGRATEHNVKCEYPVWWGQPATWRTLGLENASQAEEIVERSLPRRGWWYWCRWFDRPEPIYFGWALEMERSGDFTVPAEPEKPEDTKE
jgi:hypothetical protein